ncbi:Uncharacterised protein [Prevotella melaninogenica]|nr:Uncharacterised protein [Prevotella melaninogenica]
MKKIRGQYSVVQIKGKVYCFDAAFLVALEG